jgi:hypothetical protein
MSGCFAVARIPDVILSLSKDLHSVAPGSFDFAQDEVGTKTMNFAN